MLIEMKADRFDAGGVLRAKGTQVDVATALALTWIGDNAAAAVGASRETSQGIRKDVPVLQDRISGSQVAGDSPVSGAGIVNSRDGLGRVTSYTTGGVTYTVTYGNFGPATVNGGGKINTYNYDASGLLASITTA